MSSLLWSEKFLNTKIGLRQEKKKTERKEEKKQKRKYRKVNKRKRVIEYTRQELIRWGNQHQVRVVRDIWRLAHQYEDCPTFDNILKIFGSWGRYKKHLVTQKRIYFNKQMTDEQYIKLCINLGIDGTIKSYSEKYKKYKGILISYQRVIKRFGNWYNFKRLIKCLNVQTILQQYIYASIQKGKALTIRQSNQKGIQIQRAMNLFGKKLFNRILRQKQIMIYKQVMNK